MAGHFRKRFGYTDLLVYVLLCVKFVGSLASAQVAEDELKHSRTFRGVPETTTTITTTTTTTTTPAALPPPPPTVRLHPGLVASVVIVTAAAIMAAVFIIRKYFFPQSNATYRYSALRQMEESNNAVDREEESDEDLLE